MILTDVHNHSAYSPDGISPLADMVASAAAKGLRYFGIAEHFDYDYRAENVLIDGQSPPVIDAEAYFREARALQSRFESDTFRLLVGGELGYSPLPSAHEEYAAVIARFAPDFLVNSVHTVDGQDCYFSEYFETKPKSVAYGRYLERVRASLDVPYPYDIVAHLGYCTRNAPYEDKRLYSDGLCGLVDDILRTVIQKQKLLEVNSSVSGPNARCLPDEEVLRRYFELGGRLISFASDAHATDRIACRRAETAELLKRIGFTHIAVPDCGLCRTAAL